MGWSSESLLGDSEQISLEEIRSCSQETAADKRSKMYSDGIVESSWKTD